MTAPRHRLKAAIPGSLAGVLLSLSGCALLSPLPDAPWAIMEVRFDRLESSYSHAVEVILRGAEVAPTGEVRMRFNLTAELPENGETGEPDVILEAFTARGTAENAGDRTGAVTVQFDTPFAFLPQTPLILSQLTIIQLSGADGSSWEGELPYPYEVTETLATTPLSKNGALQ